MLDLIVGDPQRLPHPVQAIGWLIKRLQNLLRAVFPASPKGELFAGSVMVVVVCLVGFGLPFMLLWGAQLIHPYARLALECLMCWQILATKSLRVASLGVYKELAKGDLVSARKAVGMIVGRDTENLSDKDVAKASIETVAENTGDGIVAPLLYFALGGAPLAFLYKAINTMDSMVGYKNKEYLYFGRPAALLDDAANYLPARLAGFLIVVAAFFAGQNVRGSWRILWRDKRKHTSPNSAWPEAASAGALEIQLGGTSNYGGVPVAKPLIGDEIKTIENHDIIRANRLALVTAIAGLFLCGAIRFTVVFLAIGVQI